MHSVVVGLGKTGASCVRFLAKRGLPVSATDSRSAPPGLKELGDLAQRIPLRLGGFDLSLLQDASQVLLSPGVSPAEPIAQAARARGIAVLGDIELFARHVHAPVFGITGTNGKSTVTTLLALMAQRDGRRVLAGGNLGEPALDLLEHPVPQVYVLELSSFQLDTTTSLAPAAAVVLNVSADHLDRYPDLAAYAYSKSRIFERASTVVLNADDPWVSAMRGAPGARHVSFSIAHGERHGQRIDYALTRRGERTWLSRRGVPFMDTASLKIGGLHNMANALAALALGDALELSAAAMQSALEEFPGLPHRAAWVADIDGVRYLDDSKGTNVGATIAAVAGLPGPLVLIAGGQGKGQDFSPLAAAFRGKVRAALLIGVDAPLLADALSGVCPAQRCESLEEAVVRAQRAAHAGDTVLLSPACASLDMFRDYAQRGDVFAAAVRALPGVRP